MKYDSIYSSLPVIVVVKGVLLKKNHKVIISLSFAIISFSFVFFAVCDFEACIFASLSINESF